ncbi:hypothetical protein PFY12_14745 [Chryseobacterium camelliae]|uniref:Uncharacterized protein n=1 Tax=Chryseobacterium camelliae TaxID=1265445 RepID=A0ABY7QM90_9FLAO|nr:hypothetical protein [Chryseobacterium camelliae]WBV60284.1 hypothetical protein PFY12_14745 [Chryseobacterium camelliae]
MEILKHGQPISLQLSDYLKEFTTPEDIANVSTETGVSISTLNYVKRRANNVSEGNEKGIILLARKAYANAEYRRKFAMKAKKELKTLVESI